VNAYNEQKERERLEKLKQEKERKAAVRIQSWWRGMMVRHHLGPYRPKKTKGKKPKQQRVSTVKSQSFSESSAAHV
jgi:hypothetical protein